MVGNVLNIVKKEIAIDLLIVRALSLIFEITLLRTGSLSCIYFSVTYR